MISSLKEKKKSNRWFTDGSSYTKGKLKMNCCCTITILTGVSERKLWKEILTIGGTSGITSAHLPFMEGMGEQSNNIYQFMNREK